MNFDSVCKDFTHAIEMAAKGDDWLMDHKPEISVYQAGGPFEMDLGHSFVGTFKDAYKEVTGEALIIEGSPAGCDSRTWRNIAGCPTLQYGPGELVQCHAVNEHISVEEYLKAILVYANLILRWLKV